MGSRRLALLLASMMAVALVGWGLVGPHGLGRCQNNRRVGDAFARIDSVSDQIIFRVFSLENSQIAKSSRSTSNCRDSKLVFSHYEVRSSVLQRPRAESLLVEAGWQKFDQGYYVRDSVRVEIVILVVKRGWDISFISAVDAWWRLPLP